MIDPVASSAAQQLLEQSRIQRPSATGVEFAHSIHKPAEPDKLSSFGEVVGKLVGEVEEKRRAAAVETNKMLLGETDNIHQSMIAMQESGLAFNLMVEVRNKLMESYKELIRMPV